jgi:hypothetical protein
MPHFAEHLGGALKGYGDSLNNSKTSLHWSRVIRWIENILFTHGRQYLDDILISRISNSDESTVGTLSVKADITRSIPKPTNDLLGRYVETNIALLTENRPRPRVTPKSDNAEDISSAELSEFTLEYLWEELDMPEKHRELARLILHTGIAFMEIAWDPTVRRSIQVGRTREEMNVEWPEGTPPVPGGPVAQIVPRQVPVLDEQGAQVYDEQMEYGDIVSNVVSPFGFHFQNAHTWSATDMGWVMKEEFKSLDLLKDKYLIPVKDRARAGLTKENGWNLDALNQSGEENVQHLALWWWERLGELVEGPGPSIYVGTPNQHKGNVVVRTLDRAPSLKWPKGRTVITVGDQVLYDSPKKVGARAYDPRWPNRWHPYIRFGWERQVGSVYCRSLVSKLLPKLKRINNIDTTMIMYRRTVPMAGWTVPKGAMPVEDQQSGKPGLFWQYDPRRTANQVPQPIYPPPYPAAAMQEREMQLAEMEAIAGTEQILKGERPAGVRSGIMLDILRKQALASRSAILQAWDESLQSEGTLILQTVIRNVKDDARYAEKIKILAREKQSDFSIDMFSGAKLSDNVAVRVDTVSMALVSKEAREAKMIEVLQYLPNIVGIPDVGLQQAMFEELGLKKALIPSGPDINRAKKMLSYIKNGRHDLVTPLEEDTPEIFLAVFVNELKSDTFIDLPQEQQAVIIGMIDIYKRQVALRMMAQQQMAMNQQEIQADMARDAQARGEQ